MDRPLPPLPTLKAFCVIAETGGFGRAAERVGLTQTAVSHQIAQLEGWIGGALFQRGRSGATLTPLGKALHAPIAQAIDQLELALHQARATTTNKALTLSVTPEFSGLWLSRHLPEFCRRYPDIDINLNVTYRQPDFETQEIDLAIWLGPMADPRLIATPLIADEEFVVCAPSLIASLPARGAVAAAPLLRYHGMRHLLLDWQRWYEQTLQPGTDDLAGFDISAAVASGPVFDSLEEMLEACRNGAGFALVRTSVVAAAIENGDVVRCFREIRPASLDYTLLYPKDMTNRPAISLFRAWLIAKLAAERRHK